MVMESRSSAFLFSVQRALPNEMPSALTGVAVDTDEKTLYIHCYFQGSITEDELAFMEYLRDAVWADFFPTIHVEMEGLDAELAGNLPVGNWAWRSEARELAHA
ncbi:MAG: hypothetical protein K0R39_563 [Symbiobacteriaceae bacterium]|jgi:hypothetical protein|nr:hypothetical protein [Symbiobacteriaceae bacterium]